MKNKFLLSCFILFILPATQAKKEAKASKEEINNHLFSDPSATYLDDYKNKIPINRLGAGEESQFDLEKDVKFRFTSNLNQTPQIFTFDQRETITSDIIDVTKPLRVIVHGWKNEANSSMIQNVSSAYLKKQNVTLMVVDWSLLANKNYLLARDLIHDVANVTGHMLRYLVEQYLVRLENVHLIGHSLGGHTVGLVGKKLQELGLQKVPVVFALDPAGPLFSLDEKEKRVDRDDAKLVVILHTSTILGFTEPLGHVDFYANFGFSQPGCKIDLLRQCAHSRAYMYFADAILIGGDETEFWAVKCNADYDDLEAEKCDPTDVTTRFGESLHKEADSLKGLYVFETNSEQPWAKGKPSLIDVKVSDKPDAKGKYRHGDVRAKNNSDSISLGWKVVAITIFTAYIFYFKCT